MYLTLSLSLLHEDSHSLRKFQEQYCHQDLAHQSTRARQIKLISILFQGCYSELKNWVEDHAYIFIGATVVIALIQVTLWT